MTNIEISEAMLTYLTTEEGVVKTKDGYALTEITDEGVCADCGVDENATLLRPITITKVTDENCEWDEADNLVCAACGSEDVYKDMQDYEECIEDQRAEAAFENARDARWED